MLLPASIARETRKLFLIVEPLSTKPLVAFHERNAMKKQLEEAIRNYVTAGKGDIPFVCYSGPAKKKRVKKLQKWLESHEAFRVCRDTIRGRDGTYFNGIASWDMDVAVFLGNHERRFRVLQLDRLGWTTYYAIPVSMADSFSSLPGIPLSAAEIDLIKEMANELAVNGSVPEEDIYILHPAKSTIKENREQWDDEELDVSELRRMITEDPIFRYIITVVLAVHYRSFLSGEELPEGIYNFVLPKKNKDSDLWFYDVLQALTFANIPGKNVPGPITITVKAASDMKRWRCCYERVAVIRTATDSSLWSLLREIEESDQTLKSGGPVSDPLPTVPISLTNTYLHHPQAVDIPLPDEPPQMTAKQQDLLRAAMSRLLKREYAEAGKLGKRNVSS